MADNLVPAPPAETVASYRAAAINPRTQAIYDAAWSAWERWASLRGKPVLPAEPQVWVGLTSGHAPGLELNSQLRMLLSLAEQADAHSRPNG